MTEPSVVRIETRTAAGDHDVPAITTFADAQEGDVCLMVSWGAANGAPSTTAKPTYTSGGADAGFAIVTGSPVNSGNTDGRVYAWWKKLTAADFSGGNLKQFKSPDSPTLALAVSKRTSIWIFHHPDGWDDTIFSVYTDVAGFTNNVAQTLNGAGAPVRANVSIWLGGFSAAVASLTIDWDGTGGREPYVYEGVATNTTGGPVATQHTTVGHTVSVNNGTNSGTHTTLTDRDVGSVITGGGLAADATITAVNVGAGTFTVSGTWTGSGSTPVNVTPHYGSGGASGLAQGDYNFYDEGDGATSFALSIGSGSTHAIMVVTFQVAEGQVVVPGNHAIAELVPHAGAVTPVIGGGHATALLIPHAGRIPGQGGHAIAKLIPHAGTVTHGVEVQGGHATMLLVPHPQGGFVLDPYDWIIPPPTSIHVRSARLVVVARKAHVADDGDVRLTLLQDPGGTIIAQGGWQPLGDTFAEYELTIDGPTWDAIADPTQLAGLATFRRREDDTLEWEIDYAALIPAYFVQALLVPHAGTVGPVLVNGGHATMTLVPHAGSVTVPHQATNFLPFFTA